MIKLFAFLLVTYCSACCGQWVLQQSNTNQNLFGVYMFNANTGFVAGDNQTIRKTTNGGINWNILNCPNLDYGSISFLNANTGIIAAGPGSLMIQTYNGGANWVVRFPTNEPGKVQYIDSMIIYATARYMITKSTDGGISWITVDTNGNYSGFTGLYFINRDTGTSVGMHALIKTTTNGGITWTRRTANLPVQFSDSSLADIQYLNALTGYACGLHGIVIKTTNGGINWSYIPTGDLYSLGALYFTDVNNGTGVGYPVIRRTTNGGINWISQPYPPNPSQEPLDAVYFVNTYTGWIVGFSGTILNTSNGGLTWVPPISNELPAVFKLEQNYPNPFNPTTVITYDIPKSGFVSIKIYDALGREVSTLVNGDIEAGVHQAVWNGKDFTSGVYFYRIEADENNGKKYINSKKMVLVK